MMVFGLVLHESRASELARTTIDWLTQRDHEVRLLIPDAQQIGHGELGAPVEDFAVGMDLLVSLGGDGTMLKSAELAAEEDVPVLGVNLGTLGYLTEVEPSGVRMALKRFLSGSYNIEERMRLSAGVKRMGTTELEYSTALNEVVIEKSEPGHTVRMDVELDRRPFTSWVADGLILSTPTGSTAYSFSVRGPIVDPTHEAVIMAPVAPHMLFDRSMVLRPDCEVKVTVAGSRDCGLSIDGRPQTPLVPGESVTACAAKKPSRFITFGEHDFHGILRTKFGLTDR